MRNLLLIVLMAICSYTQKLMSWEHELTVCAIFQNDAKYIPEWIDFHRENGVEHFYLYNNLSTDDYEFYLEPYIKEGLVTLYEWPFPFSESSDWPPIQHAAYMDCINKIKHTDHWCAFIDTDEFLFSPDKKLPDCLQDYEEFSGVVVNWLMYGTSNVQKIPEEDKIVDYLVMRAQDNHPLHYTIKTIVQPDKVKDCVCAHYFLYHQGHAVNELKQLVTEWKSPVVSTKNFRINHYWTRDEDFLMTVKLLRRIKRVGKIEEFLREAALMNEVYDPILKSPS